MPVSVWTQGGVEQGTNHMVRYWDTSFFICLVAGEEKPKTRVFSACVEWQVCFFSSSFRGDEYWDDGYRALSKGKILKAHVPH